MEAGNRAALTLADMPTLAPLSRVRGGVMKLMHVVANRTSIDQAAPSQMEVMFVTGNFKMM